MKLNIYCLIMKIIIFNCIVYVDASEYKIWGPGLKPEIVMPARYFFIESIPNCDTNLLELIDLDIKIEGSKIDSNKPCRIWTNILNRNDGSYIVRYKLYEPCINVKIDIKVRGENIKGFPLTFKYIMFSEDCNCNIHNVSSFINNWECGETQTQIKEDLHLFKGIDFGKIRKRKCYGQHVGFKMFMDNILLSLTRKVLLPDFEMFVNLGDWPLVKDTNEIFPIFSWCGSKDSFDIVMPTYDITESTLESMGRVMLDMLSVQGNVRDKWENRHPKIFWRGRDSSRERLKLIEISRQYPDLFNVSLTNFFFFRNEMEKYGPTSKHVSFYDFFDYKYQINLDGTVAAYRFPYLLAGGSLVFKQDSKYYEFFYNNLKSNMHYIPIKQDLSDLIEKIKWAVENDEEAKTIGMHGRDFANDNLLPKNIFCYHVQLFNEYSKKVTSTVEIVEGMEMVKSSRREKCNCNYNMKDEL
ncbi:KDEL motif-containing protein 1 isoform X2 [Agrilus planipennis]|uniref:KDEL motif-containing protein 1 isoform X2 n=1 Tax=Agrilus planipennis TaxID=224129 RepID=A0A1W4WFU5_AGRPL|nr:KDEL motif-containing protein 1 isoform X2 [Agrilus planipennis]